MRILAFPGRFNARAKAPARDWSTQEIADFYRAHRLLAENGAGIGIDRGLTDEGEPWMAFFDTVSHDVFLHIARIDDYCHLVCDTFGLKLSAADIPSLIAQFEHAVRDELSIRSSRSKNVVVHPAARIIMSISAVFLLFKLENGEAHAKGLTDKVGVPGADARSADKSLSPLARAQAVFARAFDAVEAPVSAAILAGIILATELAFKPVQSENDVEAAKLLALSIVEHDAPALRDDGSPMEAVVAEAIHHEPQLVVEDLVAAQVVPVTIPLPPDAQAIVQFTPAENVVQLANVGTPADFRAAQFVPVAVQASVLVEAEPELVVDKTAAPKVVDFLATIAVVSSPQPVGPAKADKPVDISLARLPDMVKEFGFVSELNLSLSQLYSLLQHYSSQMNGYDFEYKSGQVLIGQRGIEGLRASDLGVFTNTLSDGSTYTIVGRADLIDDVLTLFT